MPLAFPLPPVIFFDAVGTLLYPEPAAPLVYASVGRRFGSRLEESVIVDRFRAAFRRQEEADQAGGWRTNEKRELARWRAIVGEVLDDVADAEGCFQELYVHFASAENWRCTPETADLFSTLAARGHVLGIASNFDHRLRGVVEQLPVLHPLHFLLISSEIGWRKPAEVFFAEMCRRANVQPEQILYVGDDVVNDYEGANKAGLRALLFDPHHRAAIAPQARIVSFTELLAD